MWNTCICGKQQFLRSSICQWEFIPLSLYCHLTLGKCLLWLSVVLLSNSSEWKSICNVKHSYPQHCNLSVPTSDADSKSHHFSFSHAAHLPCYRHRCPGEPAALTDAQSYFFLHPESFSGGKQLCCIMDWGLGTGFAAFRKPEQHPRESQPTFLCALAEQKEGLWMTKHLYFLFLSCQCDYEKQQSYLLTEMFSGLMS